MHQQRFKSLPVEAASIQSAALGFQLHFTLCAFSRIAHRIQRRGSHGAHLGGPPNAQGKYYFLRTGPCFVNETVWSASVREQMLGTHEWR